MRRIDAFTIGMFAALMISMVAPAPTAQAATRDCAKHKLFGTDAQEFRREITRIAQGQKILWKTEHGCTNPDNAYGGVDLQPKPQPDGTIIEPVVSCERGAGPWECKSGENRRLSVTPVVAGKRHKADFYLPPRFDADTARRLIQRSADLGPTLVASQECGAPPGGAADHYTGVRLNEVRRFFGFSEWITSAEIEETDTELQVRINDYALSFAPVSPAQPEIRFLCWHMLTTM